MKPKIALSPHLFQGGPLLHRHEWLRRGVSRRRLSSPEFTTVMPGYLARTDEPPSLASLARLVVESAAPYPVALCGPTAAEFLGMSVPWQLSCTHSGTIHVLSLGDHRITNTRVRTAHVDRHATSSPAFTIMGIPILPPAAVLCQLAPMLKHDDLVAACDSVLDPKRCRLPIATRAALIEAVTHLRVPSSSSHPAEIEPDGAHTPPPTRGVLRRGARTVLTACGDARENVWSAGETYARLLLSQAGYPEPELNYRVVDPLTNSVFFLDIAYPTHKLYVEYDGDWHRTDRRRYREDITRDAILSRLGWAGTRLTIEQIRRPTTALTNFAGFWEARSTRPLSA